MARDMWTDERMDDLNAKVDRGFEIVDRRFDEVDRRFDEVDRRLEQVDKRFDKVDRKFERADDDLKEFRVEMNRRLDAQNRLLIMSLLGILTCMFTGFAGMIAAQVWA